MGSLRPHILVLANVIGPDRGSEWSAAWGMAIVAAELGHVTIVCRPDCQAPLEAWHEQHPEMPIEFVAVAPLHRKLVDLVLKLPFGHFFEYFLWLAAVPERVRTIHAKRPIDLAVHAALGCHWLPSPVAELGVPSIWGSVGGATPVAPGLLRVLGLRGVAERALELIAIFIGSISPATRRTMRRSTTVLLDNENVRRAMPRDVAERAFVFQRALLSDAPMIAGRPRTHDILFPSTLNARKGTMLALEAFATVPDPYRLVFANSGPDEERLKRRTAELGLGKRVEFLGRIPRDEYFDLAKGAAMAVFAGVNEDGGCALCETMLLGVPVVVLAHSGPKEIVEQWSKDPERVVAVRPGGGMMTTVLGLGAAMRELIARAPSRTDPYLDRERAVEQLKRIYKFTMTVHAHDHEMEVST